MVVTCTSCGARYQYDESRFGDSLVKHLKCSKCGNVYEVRREHDEGDVLQSTATRRTDPDETTRELELRKLRVADENENLPDLAPLPAEKRYSLAVIMGANSGQIYSIKTPRVYLGRGAGADIQLPDSEISRRHAMLEINDDMAALSDLGSTNGTFVDGVRITKSTIGSHQEFSLGTTTLMFIVTHVNDGAV